jgi:hypothetical protein
VTPNPTILQSVEKLGYRVTVGDVAAQAGLEINLAQRGLLALASDAGGHLQVAESGEIVYLFPKNFRAILRNKFWRLRLQEWWEKIWGILFYLIRISFGIILVVSILLMAITIAIILISLNSSRDGDSSSDRSSGGGGIIFFPTDIFWIFNPTYDYNRYERQSPSATEREGKGMNFLEAVFSFLFGDGNPNFNLEENRWREIGSVIQNCGGAIVAEQIAPYLDNIDNYNIETEDYILPVLSRFNGYPKVSPQGNIIYYFPELQVTAKKRKLQQISEYLQEKFWRFSQADGGQILLAIGLGALNFILALVLGSFLQEYAISGAWFDFIRSIYWLLIGYAGAFLGIPLLRYFWVQWKNRKVAAGNQQRQARTKWLEQPDSNLQEKIGYACQFAAETVISDRDITYSTEHSLESGVNKSDVNKLEAG